MLVFPPFSVFESSVLNPNDSSCESVSLALAFYRCLVYIFGLLMGEIRHLCTGGLTQESSACCAVFDARVCRRFVVLPERSYEFLMLHDDDAANIVTPSAGILTVSDRFMDWICFSFQGLIQGNNNIRFIFTSD